jgi:hypothetical protein
LSLLWPKHKSRAELRKLQRLAYLGITGAMRTTPIHATEVLLRLSPLHMKLEAKFKQEYTHTYSGHRNLISSKIQARLHISENGQRTHLVDGDWQNDNERHAYNKASTIRFPDRSEGMQVST